MHWDITVCLNLSWILCSMDRHSPIPLWRQIWTLKAYGPQWSQCWMRQPPRWTEVCPKKSPSGVTVNEWQWYVDFQASANDTEEQGLHHWRFVSPRSVWLDDAGAHWLQGRPKERTAGGTIPENGLQSLHTEGSHIVNHQLIREAKTSSEVTVVGEARPAAEAVSNLRVSLILKISQIDTTGARVEFLKSFWQFDSNLDWLSFMDFHIQARGQDPTTKPYPVLLSLYAKKGTS